MTTAWVPWDDVPVEAGGLAVLAGSSSLPGFDRLRRTYAEADVSATDIEASWGGSYTADPVELSAFDPAARWLTADYHAGDVLLFTVRALRGV
jgi:ectoine hydroxylase-related dioxygenase (phytanoyl-CoA dioxygenase family)